MSGPQVHFTLPKSFSPFPSNLPNALPPPVKERTFRSPFGITPWLFNFALRPEVPVIFAAAYIIFVFSLNAYNRKRDWKPWWIARQRPFQWFVVVHNVLLAIYSSATFLAMLRAITHTWPGWNTPNRPAEWADALCKMHGPRGLGDAATFNTTINIWEVKNQIIRLGYDGNPDPTDVGRLWNEGLAFWGWVFYVSKFYEVIDTFIILAKGKRSATLQTYHHAGAMLCMWAGIRYMSPPIWMFVFINSFIHAMMYTYFTLSALGYRVPQGLKRFLTTLQIAQFVFGATYAAAHLFVEYDIPIATPYQVVSTIQRAASSVSSAAASATSAVSHAIESPIPSATLGALLKKLLLRAAGEEGVAERVHDERGELTTPNIEEKIERFNEQTFETRWRTNWTRVKCIDTTGEAFAIYLNLLYLFPLTVLFARFFIRAYTQRGKPRTASQAAKQTTSSAKEGGKRTKSIFEERGEEAEEHLAQLESETAEKVRRAENELEKLGSEGSERVRKDAKDLQEQLREDLRRMKEGKLRGDRRVSDRVASFERQVKTAGERAKEKGKQLVNGSGSGSPRRGSPSKKQEEGSNDEDAVEDEPEKEPKNEGPEEKLASNEQSSGKGNKSEKDVKQAESDEKHEEKSTASDHPAQGDGGKNEPKEKQDENMAESQPLRPGTGTGSDGAADEDDDKENRPPSQSQGSNNEPEEKQDENMAESQATRPGADEDTDAMGKSGAIVNRPEADTEDAQEEGEGEEKAGTSTA